MENVKNLVSVASNERIAKLVEEAESELIKIQPEITYLEECQKKLQGLKEHQFRLNSLIMSLKSLLKNSCVTNFEINQIVNIEPNESKDNVKVAVNITRENNEESRKVFLPDQAISQVKNFLRPKNNLNYEIFKAIVFNSGQGSTAEIKQYLVENNIKQPKSGKGFEYVELKEISSRANYLVRKSILVSPEPGIFRSVFGWCDVE